MRAIRSITLHCSASDRPKDDSISVIRAWHTLPPPKGNGWKDIGYHFFIPKSGHIFLGRPIEEIPASSKGHNADTIAICLSGDHLFTGEQFRAAAYLCASLLEKYKLEISDIYPHNHFNPLHTCPNFDIKKVTLLIGFYFFT